MVLVTSPSVCFNIVMWKKYLETNYEVNEEGLVRNINTKRVLTPILKPTFGYFEIRISIRGAVKTKRLHRLIYEAHFGKIKGGLTINHINGIKTDNRIENLEAVTGEINNKRRINLRKGVQVNTAKLTETQVMEIRTKKRDGANSRDMGREYGITKSAVNRIASGKTWKSLPIYKVDNSIWSDPKITGSMSGKQLQTKYGKDYFKKIANAQKIKNRCKHCGQVIKEL